MPAGIAVDEEFIARQMSLRKSVGAISTPRKEADAPEFLSGIVDGFTCGAPIAAIIHNTNTRSGDYNNLKD